MNIRLKKISKLSVNVAFANAAVFSMMFFLISLAQAQSGTNSVASGTAAVHIPKIRVVVKNTEDRWITFSDNTRIYHGSDISYMLSQSLFDSGKFELLNAPIVVDTQGISVLSTSGDGVTAGQLSEADLKERLPQVNFSYLNTQINSQINNPARGFSAQSISAQALLPDMTEIIIQPRVQTLLYSSGDRSNKLVMGFAPDRLNLFNAGKAGSLDNEFVVQPPTPTQAVCNKPDFFQGAFEAQGYGPWKSNFGANADEGFSFSLLGFGIGFKKKSYIVDSEIVFDVTYPLLGQTKSFTYSTQGKGSDIFVAGSYAGFSLALEIQKKKTLRQALAEMLPQIVASFTQSINYQLWQSQIYSLAGGISMQGGYENGVDTSMTFVSSNGNLYTPLQILETVTLLQPAASNRAAPVIGEQLRVWSETQNPWDSVTIESASSGTPATTTVQSALDLQQQSDPTDLKNLTAAFDSLCPTKKVGWFEQLMMDIMEVYALYRYNEVYDQPFDKIVAPVGGVKVAMVSSGISPKEKKLAGNLENSGFDFVAWDERPADDNGAGTASSLYLKSLTKKNFTLVPIKVVGAYGEVHSSEIYSALHYLASRTDISIVSIPFSPTVKSQAYEMGISELIKSGKTVVVPNSYSVTGATMAVQSTNKKLKVKALESKITISNDAAGVIEKTAQLIESAPQ